MKLISYGKVDFPTGFDAAQLANELTAAHGQAFSLETAVDYVKLNIGDTDNEVAIRATCVAHFSKPPAQRADDAANTQSDQFFINGDKQRRFIFDLFYRLDQRLRVLEAAPAITRAQFFNGLKNIYKNI